MCCGLSSLRYKNRVLEKMCKRTFISILEDQRHNHKPPEGVPSACREISLQSCNSFMCACLCVCVCVCVFLPFNSLPLSKVLFYNLAALESAN